MIAPLWAVKLLAKPAIAVPLGILKSVPGWVWLGLAIVLACLWYGSTRFDAGVAHERAAQARAQAVAVAAVLKQRDAAEAADRKQMAAIGARFDKEKDHALFEAQRLAACYRSGKCRVHARFQCPAQPGVLPETAGTPAEGDGAGEGGLLDEDAAFLVGEAGRADAVALQLQACQAVIRADRD